MATIPAARRTRSNRTAGDTNAMTRKPATRPEQTVVETPQPRRLPRPPPAELRLRQLSRSGSAHKAPTQLHRDFAQWLTANTGHEMDPKAVQLTISLLGDYQKSPDRKAARDQAQRDRQATLAGHKAATEKKAAERKEKLEKQLAAIKAKLSE